MKPSSATLFRSLAAKIHPQVILSSKESSQFLGALTASFRQKLDEAHPLDHVAAVKTRTSGPLTLTERHVASVLTNPLLAHTKHEQSPAAHRHPIDIFESCVANGTASLETAAQCLSSFRRLLRSEAKEARHKAITQYQPGSKVVSWLWANDLARSDVFQHNSNLYKAVVFFLVKEGRSEVVHNWIKSASDGPIDDNIHSSPKSVLLDWLVTCEVKSSRQGYKRALSTFLDTVDAAPAGLARFAHVAGTQLAQLARLQAPNTPHDFDLLHRFVESYSRWRASALEPVAIDISCLKLQHAPVVAIEDALALARTLSVENVGSRSSKYGEKPMQFLVLLSDAIQNHGTQVQADQFVALLQDVSKKDKGSSEESPLFRASRGVSSMLLHELNMLKMRSEQVAHE